MAKGDGVGLEFTKYHGLGNDYLVMPGGAELGVQQVQRVCDRHRGIGSDGILVPDGAVRSPFGLRILNPDGSEAEKSGNGLRIYARWLHDRGLVADEPFDVLTAGGRVSCRVSSPREIVVDMGRVRFAGHHGELLREQLEVDSVKIEVCAADLGNPHCVVLDQPVDEKTARSLGPLVERHARFPARTNVQFLAVRARDAITIEIWERGAGYTLASGSSSCAAAAVAHALGLVDEAVRVSMPGGRLDIDIGRGFRVGMRGPATRVARGRLSDEVFE